LSTNWMVVFCV